MLGRYPRCLSCSFTPCKVLGFGPVWCYCLYALCEQLRDFMSPPSFQIVCCALHCVSPSTPETEGAVEGSASPCSKGAWSGAWDQMFHLAEENSVSFFDLSNDPVSETRKTSCVVQKLQQNTANHMPELTSFLSPPTSSIDVCS